VDVSKHYKGPVFTKLDLPLSTFDIPTKEFKQINSSNNDIEALYAKYYKLAFKNSSKIFLYNLTFRHEN
jgi:hypothetical protein